MVTLSTEKGLPKLFQKKLANRSPINSILFLIFVNLFSVFLTILKVLNIEKIVSFANIFFILNALFGILSLMNLYRIKINLLVASVLTVMLLFLLVFSNKSILSIPIIIIGDALYKNRIEKRKVDKVDTI